MVQWDLVDPWVLEGLWGQGVRWVPEVQWDQADLWAWDLEE